jgi:hypothetical protein
MTAKALRRLKATGEQMSHDFEVQRQGTVESFAEMGKGLPARAVVSFQFAAEDVAPNWGAAEKALVAAGFTVRRDEAEGMLEAVVGPVAFTADEVWLWEKKATEVLLKWDFWPDGWEVE